MIKLFRDFYRRNFCSETLVLLYQLFEQHPELERGIVFTESMPLTRTKTHWIWLEAHDAGQLHICEYKSRIKVEHSIRVKELTKADFNEVIDYVQKTSESLGSYSGRVKDGVFYSLCWGTPSKHFALNIRNPQVGSKPHETFVNTLKHLAEK